MTVAIASGTGNTMIFILAFLLAVADASITKCTSALSIHDLNIDPPAIVATNQPVHMQIAFEIPENTYIPQGTVEIATSWNGLALTTERRSLGEYINVPLFAGSHVFKRSFIFPADVFGRISSTIKVYNSSGSGSGSGSGSTLLCAQWIVFATGTNKNETVWPWSALYT